MTEDTKAIIWANAYAHYLEKWWMFPEDAADTIVGKTLKRFQS